MRSEGPDELIPVAMAASKVMSQKQKEISYCICEEGFCLRRVINLCGARRRSQYRIRIRTSNSDLEEDDEGEGMTAYPAIMVPAGDAVVEVFFCAAQTRVLTSSSRSTFSKLSTAIA